MAGNIVKGYAVAVHESFEEFVKEFAQGIEEAVKKGGEIGDLSFSYSEPVDAPELGLKKERVCIDIPFTNKKYCYWRYILG